MARRFLCGVSFAFVLVFVACGGGENEESTVSEAAPAASSSGPSGDGACGLLMQGEVDELFGTSIGPGVSESLEDGAITLCSWPGNEPALLLQISEASADISAAVDLGDGYRVYVIHGMNGPAAAAVEVADGPETVVVIAMVASDRTITLSPVGLGMTETAPQYRRLKELMNLISSRIG